MTIVDQLLASQAEIHIISGEGHVGTREVYKGARTVRAIKRRLTAERAGGERWARVQIYSHANAWGDVGVDLDGYPDVWHEADLP